MATLVIGDSVAWQIAEGLRTRGHDILNGGLGGSSPAKGTLNYSWPDHNLAADLIDFWNPDKIVVHLGGNSQVWGNGLFGIEPYNTAWWRSQNTAGLIDVANEIQARMDDEDVVWVHGYSVNVFNPYSAGDWAHALTWLSSNYQVNTFPGLYPDFNYVNFGAAAVSNLVNYVELNPYRAPGFEGIHLSVPGQLYMADRVGAALLATPDPPPDPGPPPVLEEPAPPDIVVHPDLDPDGSGTFTPFTVSAQFRRTIPESHESRCRVDVFRRESRDPIYELAVVDGSLTLDAGATTERSGRITAIDFDGTLSPGDALDILSPQLCELQVWLGPKYADGTEELVSQAILKVDSRVIRERDGGLTFELVCFDRSIRAKRTPIGRPLVIGGAPVEDVTRDLLWAIDPTMDVEFPETGDVVPTLMLPDTATYWGEAHKLWLMSGYTLRVNRNGLTTAEATAVAAELTPRWSFIEGSRATFFDAERAQAEGIPNRVVVRSSNSNLSGIVGEAVDDDPASPTYIGTYGPITEEVPPDPRITTQEQADRAAAAILARKLGPGESIPLNAIPNPALNLDETVRVERAVLGLATNVLVDHIEIPLTADKHMQVRTRRSVITDSATLTTVLA